MWTPHWSILAEYTRCSRKINAHSFARDRDKFWTIRLVKPQVIMRLCRMCLLHITTDVVRRPCRCFTPCYRALQIVQIGVLSSLLLLLLLLLLAADQTPLAECNLLMPVRSLVISYITSLSESQQFVPSTAQHASPRAPLLGAATWCMF